MNELTVPTAQNINKAHRLARESAETAVQFAIKCGELLLAKQKETPHGELQAWIEANCSFAVSTAKRYMTAAKQQAAGIAFSSLRQCFPSGRAEKAPEQMATAVAEQVDPVQMATAVAKDEPPVDGAEPEADEESRLNEYYSAMEKAVDGGAQEQIKRMADELATVKATRDGFMNGKTEAVTHVKRLTRANERLERENATLRAANVKLKAENADLRKAVKAAA